MPERGAARRASDGVKRGRRWSISTPKKFVDEVPELTPLNEVLFAKLPSKIPSPLSPLAQVRRRLLRLHEDLEHLYHPTHAACP
jgi:hypothetical protein